jgi:probable F420-dependent oxidoreductase
VKIDVALDTDPAAAEDEARVAESEGYDGLWLGETTHDPLLGCALAARSTSRIGIGTGIAIAFARSPMTLAVSANDLQLLTGGRFTLGLGSQVKAHITRRFSMPWSHPAPRMREFVLALRAIWRSWHEDEPLDFTGDFYSHTLMTPFFTPARHPFGSPPIFLAGVGDGMTRVAGEVADGLLCHAFTTERYLREVTMPTLSAARSAAGSSLDGFTVSGVPFVVTGTTEEEMRQATRAVREQIAFYASTPSYRPVLDVHGWGELQTELTALSKAGRWKEMADSIDDEVLSAFAVVEEPHRVAAEVRRRYGDVFTRVHLRLRNLPPDLERAIAGELRTEPDRSSAC